MKKIVVLILILILTGCGKTRWYKPGASQWDFNRDERECLSIAHLLAKDATVGGKKEDLETFILAYKRCLYQKGWTNIPLADEQNRKKAVDLASVHGKKINGFGLNLYIPFGFKVISNQKKIFGPSIIHSFFLKNEKGVFINLIFQENMSSKFKKVPYEVGDNYFVYDRFFHKKNPLTWTLYFGKFQNAWVKCIGGFYYVSKHKRIIFVISSTLSPPDAVIPGLGYSKGQIEEIKSFLTHYLKWINLNFKKVESKKS